MKKDVVLFFFQEQFLWDTFSYSSSLWDNPFRPGFFEILEVMAKIELHECLSTLDSHSFWELMLLGFCASICILELLSTYHFHYFGRCIDVTGAYSAQKTELNISLTAIGLLWTSTDFIIKGVTYVTETEKETGFQFSGVLVSEVLFLFLCCLFIEDSIMQMEEVKNIVKTMVSIPLILLLIKPWWILLIVTNCFFLFSLYFKIWELMRDQRYSIILVDDHFCTPFSFVFFF